MTYYYIIFVITLLIQFINVKNDKQYLWRTVLTFLPLFLLGALRTNWGDYDSYEDLYYLTHSWGADESLHSEVGYQILNSIIPSWRLFLIITSAFTCFGFGFVFYKCVPQKLSWLAVCLYFLAGDKTVFFMYSGIRNALAIAIMCSAFVFIRERRWIPYTALTLIAITLHTSAVLFMPLAFLIGTNKPMSKREASIWIAIMLLLQVVSLNSLFGQLTEWLYFGLDRYATYATKIESVGDTRSWIIRLLSAVFVISFVWFMRTTNLTKAENVVCRIALLYSISHLLGALNFRFTQCFIVFFIVGVVIMINNWKNKPIAYTFAFFVVVYLSYAFFVVAMSSEHFEVYRQLHSIINI